MIRQAAVQDCGALSALALRLWPEHTPQELEIEFASILASKNSAVFLYYAQSRPVAFAQCELRTRLCGEHAQQPRRLSGRDIRSRGLPAARNCDGIA